MDQGKVHVMVEIAAAMVAMEATPVLLEVTATPEVTDRVVATAPEERAATAVTMAAVKVQKTDRHVRLQAIEQ